MNQKDFTAHPIKLFASYYKPHIRLFALDMFCALVACAADLIFPYATRYTLNSLLPDKLFGLFFAVMAILAGAYVLKAVCKYVITYLGHLMGTRIEADMRTDILTHIQTLSFSFFDRNRTGVLMSRVTNDLFAITELSHHGPENLMTSLITLLGAFAILCTICWPLACVILAVVPLFILFTIHWNGKMDAANAEVKKSLGTSTPPSSRASPASAPPRRSPTRTRRRTSSRPPTSGSRTPRKTGTRPWACTTPASRPL